MTANAAFVRGLVPDGPGNAKTRIVPLNNAYDWFIGSPYALVDGKAVPVGTTDDAAVCGCVVTIRDGSGSPALNLAAGEAEGVGEVTYERDQMYRAHVKTGGVVTATTARALSLNFEAESATARTTTTTGDAFSARSLIAPSSTGYMQCMGVVPTPGNLPANDNCEIYVKIASDNWSDWS